MRKGKLANFTKMLPGNCSSNQTFWLHLSRRRRGIAVGQNRQDLAGVERWRLLSGTQAEKSQATTTPRWQAGTRVDQEQQKPGH